MLNQQEAKPPIKHPFTTNKGGYKINKHNFSDGEQGTWSVEALISLVKSSFEWGDMAEVLDHWILTTMECLERLDDCGYNESELYSLLEDYLVYKNNTDSTLSERQRIYRWCYYKFDELIETCEEKYEFIVFKITFRLLHSKRYKFIPEDIGVIYFIKNSNNLIKIGFTSNLEQRVDTLNRSAGGGLVVVHVYHPLLKSLSEVEAGLHSIYAENRVIGEWFNIPISVESWEYNCKILDV